jgi:hypothetical protein
VKLLRLSLVLAVGFLNYSIRRRRQQQQQQEEEEEDYNFFLSVVSVASRELAGGTSLLMMR